MINEKNQCQVAPGARVRLAADWGKLHAGDELVVSHLDGPGLVVSSLDAKEELWIPASLIPNSSISRAWSFRPRKAEADKQMASHASISDRKIEPPKILVHSISSPIRVSVGDMARLSFEVANADGATVVWRREGRDEMINTGGDERHQVRQGAGLIYLEISRCRVDDAGVYESIITSESGSCSAKISLCVTGKLAFLATYLAIVGLNFYWCLFYGFYNKKNVVMNKRTTFCKCSFLEVKC